MMSDDSARQRSLTETHTQLRFESHDLLLLASIIFFCVAKPLLGHYHRAIQS